MSADQPGSRVLPFVKGHGTENDFVLIPDVEGVLELSASDVEYLCDRRAGIGADGVIRVVPTAKVGEVSALAGAAEWFMDYRNADGSIAQMCGNGARVFVRYLVEQGLVDSAQFAIATRGGVREVRIVDDLIAINMGAADLSRVDESAQVTVDRRTWGATPIFIPNPHAVVFVDDLDEAGSLHEAPVVDAPGVFPEGVNVEFAVTRGPHHVEMRVFERGVGETRSCGTGACAVAVAAALRDHDDSDDPWTIDVPGGRVLVAQGHDGNVVLTGPAVLVAHGVVAMP